MLKASTKLLMSIESGKIMNKRLWSIIPLVFLIGCASQRYAWNGYDASLYGYYKNPADKEKFIERLREIILKAEQTGKVPPGIYAEYGYTFYEKKDYGNAIAYFQKERDAWPESKSFMEKMILNAKSMMEKNKEAVQ